MPVCSEYICYICAGGRVLEEDESNNEAGDGSPVTKPPKIKDGLYSVCACDRWVHAQCLRRFMQEIQETRRYSFLCPECQTPYVWMLIFELQPRTSALPLTDACATLTSDILLYCRNVIERRAAHHNIPEPTYGDNIYRNNNNNNNRNNITSQNTNPDTRNVGNENNDINVIINEHKFTGFLAVFLGIVFSSLMFFTIISLIKAALIYIFDGGKKNITFQLLPVFTTGFISYVSFTIALSWFKNFDTLFQFIYILSISISVSYNLVSLAIQNNIDNFIAADVF